MGKRHPNAGLKSPRSENAQCITSLKKAIASFRAAESAGHTPSTQAALHALRGLFSARSTKADATRLRGASSAIIAASLGATYDRYLPENATREAVRRKLRRLREITTPTVPDVDAAMAETEFSSGYAQLVASGDYPDSGLGRLTCAMYATTPSKADPYDFIVDDCGCLNGSGEQKKAHGDIWYHAPGSNGFPKSSHLHLARRKNPDVEVLRLAIHELVKQVQADSAGTHKAVTDHASAAAKAKEIQRNSDSLNQLAFRAQRSNGASSAVVRRQPLTSSALSAASSAQPGAGSSPTSTAVPSLSPAIATTTRLNTVKVNELVAQTARGTAADHSKSNGDKPIVRPAGADGACFVYGPVKAPQPGAEPQGLRQKLDRHIVNQRSGNADAGLVMDHRRGTSPTSSARGPRRPRPQASDYGQTSKTMTVDFSTAWARGALRQAGYNSVPCHRLDCDGHTSPIGTRSKQYQQRVWLAFGLGGEIQGVVARRSTCAGCKSHYQGLDPSASPTLWTFCHVNPVTLARVPNELLSDSFVDPSYMNPAAGLWPCRCVSNVLEYDVIAKQGFGDVVRKLDAAAGLLASTIFQEYEMMIVQWWSGLEKIVSNTVWETLSDSEGFQLALERAEYIYFRRFTVKHAPIVPCKTRLDARTCESMYLEFVERHRLSLLIEYQSRVPTKDLSIDHTFEVATRLGGKRLLTLTNESNYLLAAVVAEDGKMETTADILTAVATRSDYPQHGDLILNVDDRRVTADGTVSLYESTLTAASKSRAMVQDYFHVTKNYGGFFSRFHPRHYEWATVKFRDATRVRDAGCESTVDARLLDGLIASKATFGGAQHVIRAWKTEANVLEAERAKLIRAGGKMLELGEVTTKLNELRNLRVDVGTIAQWKSSGLYHAHFSASRNGNGAVVPLTLRSEDDMDRRWSLYEADFIQSMFEQSWMFEEGQQVVVASSSATAAGAIGTVSTLDPSLVAAAGIPVVTGAGTVLIPRRQLIPTDSKLVWTAKEHASVERSEVVAYTNQFQFRRRTDKMIIESVAEFMKQTCTVRERLSLCRPPQGIPQHAPTVDPSTGKLVLWNGMQVHRQLHHTNNSELNHNRILDIHESSNYTDEMSVALMLTGVNDKNRRNGVARGDTTCPHNHVWLEQDRKSLRLANTNIFGNVLPATLQEANLPTETQIARAAPAASGLDQPGKALLTRLDAKMGRGAASKSGAVAVPISAAPTRPPVAANLAIPELADDTVKMALELVADLDNMEVLIREARIALVKGSRTSAVQARTTFAQGLARVTREHLQQSGLDVGVLLNSAEVSTPARTEPEPAPASADPDPAVTPARTEPEPALSPAAADPESLAAPAALLPANWIAYATTNENHGGVEVGRVYYHNATTGATQWAVPTHDPLVAEPADDDDTAMRQPEPGPVDAGAAVLPGAAASESAAARKRKSSSPTLSNAKRSKDRSATFGSHNSSGNHPCTCGRNHMPIRPTVGDNVGLRRVSGWRRGVKGSVMAVMGDTATVQLNCDSAIALRIRTYPVKHANILYSNVSLGRCDDTCLRVTKKKSDVDAKVGDTAAVVSLNLTTGLKSEIGHLECTGSDNQLGLRSNGQHDLIGWDWQP